MRAHERGQNTGVAEAALVEEEKAFTVRVDAGLETVRTTVSGSGVTRLVTT